MADPRSPEKAAGAASTGGPAAGAGVVAVWDWPVRLFHWGTALLVGLLWWTAEYGQMRWHMRCGAALLGLLVFRILWGFFGSSTARFGSFLKGPAAVLGHLRSGGRANGGRANGEKGRKGMGHGAAIGHNPAGGWSVVAMLAALLAQASLGLFAGDPFDRAAGPLNDLVGVATAAWMTTWHEWLFNAILALVAVHLGAIAFYRFVLGDHLIMPMITGRRALPIAGGREGGAHLAMAPAPAWRGWACALPAAGLALWLHKGAPPL